ncbi:hypothetical protein GQ53DRAFT_745178 [Thozetella sp. PMI_491]|nr:hypothetical protein GQ53DRAFT_745178 [Thozetella sp. PMI_491]
MRQPGYTVFFWPRSLLLCVLVLSYHLSVGPILRATVSNPSVNSAVVLHTRASLPQSTAIARPQSPILISLLGKTKSRVLCCFPFSLSISLYFLAPSGACAFRHNAVPL